MTAKDFFLSPAGRDFLLREYVKNVLSLRAVAKICPVPASMTTVRRGLLDNNITPRTATEAFDAAAGAGRHKNPTKGRARTQRERERISEGTRRGMLAMSGEVREKRGERLRAVRRERVGAGDTFGEDGLKRAKAVEYVQRFVNNLELVLTAEKLLFERPGELTAGRAFVRVDVLLPRERIALDISEGKPSRQTESNAAALAKSGYLHLTLVVPKVMTSAHRRKAASLLREAVAEVRRSPGLEGARVHRL